MSCPFKNKSIHASKQLPDQSFKRLIPSLVGLNPTQADLDLLAKTMLDPVARGPLDGSKLPAGLTYLGQFIDHDLTLDQTSVLGTIVDVNTLPNVRTSWFDLDNVYGLNNEFLNPQGFFDIGVNANGEDDLPRDPSTGIAIIADGRDEENLIISQLQLLFLKFHNKVFSEIQLQNPTLTVPELIVKAKQTVTLHYQYIVVNDFLANMCGKFFSRLFDTNGKPIISSEIQAISPSLAIEFSGAIYRYGHSLVRDAYYINVNFDVFPIFSPDLPSPLVTIPDLRGFKPLPNNFTIDWSMFFPMPGFKGFQVTENMDTFITDSLYNLPQSVATNPSILPLRNLMRGVTYGLPSGQDLARAFGIPESEVLAASKGNLVFQSLNTPLVNQTDLHHLTTVFGEQTPLFYYGLKDNHVNGNGIHLGALPSKIIGETFLSLLVSNPTSYISTGWLPTVGQFGCINPNQYTITDLICYTFNIKNTPTDLIPTIDSNYFDPFENKQGKIGLVGHALVPTLGNPVAPAADILINPYPGMTIGKFDPTLALPINTTQAEVNQIAKNAVAHKLDSTLAVVQFIYNKIILGIAQGLILPLAPPAPPADIFSPSVPIIPNSNLTVNLTPDQIRAKAIFNAIDKASYMLKPNAILDAPRASQEVTNSLVPGAIPVILLI